MRSVELPVRPGKRRGRLDGFVFSSRVRLARNIEGLNFPMILSETDKSRIDSQVTDRLKKIRPDSLVESVSRMDKSQVMAFLANRVITADFLKNGRVFAYDPGGQWVLLVNEDDHIRIFSLETGYSARDQYARVSGLLAELEQTVDFAFDETYGYLTSSILNVGTGLRISALVNLFGLVGTKRIENFIDSASKIGYSAVNIADGRDSGLFMIYNIYSLGIPEEEMLSDFEHFLQKVLDLETLARADHFGKKDELEIALEELFELNILKDLDWPTLLYYVSLIDALNGTHLTLRDASRLRSLVNATSDDYLQYRLNIEKESLDTVRLKSLRTVASRIKYHKAAAQHG